MSDQPDLLAVALDELCALGGRAEQDAIGTLRGRLADQRLRVLVTGEAKRGKSTVANALLGRDVLPTGVTPLTALATTVRYGPDEGVTATFRDGTVRPFPLAALDELVTERGNPGNIRNLASVVVLLNLPLLARGVELVDTPGTGSVYEHNTAQARLALDSMDAAVVVLTGDPPVSASERELISRAAGLSVTMFVVLNKSDRLGGSDLDEVLAFTEEVVGGAAGRSVRIYPVSARAACSGSGDAGFAGFAGDFAIYLEQGRRADLRRSVCGHARRMADSLRDEVSLTRRAAEMRSSDAAIRVQAFTDRLAAVKDRCRDASDLAAGESKRMLEALNEAADQAARECTSRVSAQLADLLDHDLRSARAAEMERVGSAKLAELAVREAEEWRSGQATMMEAALRQLDERLISALQEELAGVRESAAELLGLDLKVAPSGQRLVPDLRFFYLDVAEAGQTELLAGAIRRRLPGQAGRRRARDHLRRETVGLVPQQVGRARADLQYRLAETTRRLVRAVSSRYDESAGRLQEALAEAAAVRTANADVAATHDQELQHRLAALDRVLALLDQVALRAGQSTGQNA